MRDQLCQRRTVGLPRRTATQPVIDAHQVDRHGRENVLQLGLGQAKIACPPQAHATHSLRQGAFNASTGLVGLAELRRLLSLPAGLQGLMGRLMSQMHHPSGCLSPRTVYPYGAVRTGLLRELRLDALVVDAPVATVLSLRAGHLLGLPVNLKVRQIEALACFGLPTGVG